MSETRREPGGDDAAGPETRRTVPSPGRWASAIDELIEEAMKRGDFDNLPGHGHPLDLKRNPYGAGYELAYELLRNNDYTLPWIAGRNAVLAEIDELIAEVGRAWRQHAAELAVTQSELVAATLVAGWRRYLADVEARLPEINGRVAAANLKQPAARLEILKVTLDSVLARAGAGRELGGSPR